MTNSFQKSLTSHHYTSDLCCFVFTYFIRLHERLFHFLHLTSKIKGKLRKLCLITITGVKTLFKIYFSFLRGIISLDFKFTSVNNQQIVKTKDSVNLNQVRAHIFCYLFNKLQYMLFTECQRPTFPLYL